MEVTYPYVLNKVLQYDADNTNILQGQDLENKLWETLIRLRRNELLCVNDDLSLIDVTTGVTYE